ncbi:MAG: oxygen-independent coproporphyrinogen III oxidase-like protein [Gammaproteobacteria bacterium]|nr:oxygen-independent coproporphyrinogen III oxidase-like protein [Gammaproteobacteria bacterium]
MFNFSTLPPLSLYIHFPWCVRKCPYCDFNSHEVKNAIPEAAYIESLVKDLENDLPLIWGRRISSIFIGGGTPSLISPESLNSLLSSIRARLPINPDIEITLEANPGSVEQSKFDELRSLGINRISIGVQSFDDNCLQRLGRIHNASESVSAIETAYKANFDNVNIDLMFGLPAQTPDSAINDINTAIDLNPTHISYYQLTVEPNTYFHKNPPSLPEDESIYRNQQTCQALLQENRYQQYEVSAYARQDMQCRHNLNYWQFGDYLGIGAGAHAKITNASEQSIHRYWKVKQPQDYINKVAVNEQIGGKKKLTRQDAGFEFLLNALRLTNGFETQVFSVHTGLPIFIVEKQLKEAKIKGLIDWDLTRVRPTESGRRYLNDLLELFLPGD